MCSWLPSFRYANRAKSICNQARVNEDPKDALLRKLQEEINKLKEQLEQGEEEVRGTLEKENGIKIAGTREWEKVERIFFIFNIDLTRAKLIYKQMKAFWSNWLALAWEHCLPHSAL